MIDRRTIDTILETARVEEVIGEFVQLKKAGSNLKGLSPFTDEKTPSFMVSPVKQIWKCFSTGKGGNAVSFLMEHEHFSYPEALKWLGKKYNIEIQESEQTDEQKKQADERESMFLVSKFAKDYFHDILMNSQNGRAIGLSYFKERGFREDTIEKFALGYCKDEWDGFTKTALKKGFDLKYLKATGLTIVKEGGEKDRIFDRFKGRVMFPIHSMSGRILGFGGRILTNDKKSAKYLNSPESDIYHKSKILYGLYQAKSEIAKLDNCYLVEGYTDVISFYQSGIKNVVASSGTALTPDQIRLIHRLTPNITVLYDGDDAGIRASLRGIDLILEQGMNVKVVLFPEGEDPDSFAKANSDDYLKDYLKDNQQDFISFKVSLLIKDAEDDPIKKASLVRDIVTSIAKIPDPIKQEIYIQECSKLMEVSERVLFSELAQIINKEVNDKVKSPTKKPILEVVKEQKTTINGLEVLEREIIKLLILYGNKEIVFTNWIDSYNEEGEPIIEKQHYLTTVAKEVYLSLQEDEIAFSNQEFQDIYAELITTLNQGSEISAQKIRNIELSNMVASIDMDEDKYKLSNWNKKHIYVASKEDKVDKLTHDLLLNFRRILIEEKIKKIMTDITEQNITPDLEEVQNYNNLKKLLFNKLNRVV